MAEKLGIISSLEPLKKGDEFSEFPLHVTLMTWFDMSHKEAFTHQLQNFAARNATQAVIGGEEAMFGPNNDIRVRKLGTAGSLYAMHVDLLDMVTKLDGKVWSGGYVGEDYIPHVTYQGDHGLEEGDVARLSHIQLISGDETGPRTVLANLGLLKGTRR